MKVVELDEPLATCAVNIMALKIAAIEAEIKELADEGDTFGCDICHAKIGALESAQAIMLGTED